MATYYLEGAITKQFPLSTELLDEALFHQIERNSFWRGSGKLASLFVTQLLLVADKAPSERFECVIYSTLSGNHRLITTDRMRSMNVTFGKSDTSDRFVALSRDEVKPVAQIIKISSTVGLSISDETFYIYGKLKDNRRWIVSLNTQHSQLQTLEQLLNAVAGHHLELESTEYLVQLAQRSALEAKQEEQRRKVRVTPKMEFSGTSVYFPNLSDKVFDIPSARMVQNYENTMINAAFITKLPDVTLHIQFPEKINNYSNGPVFLRWYLEDISFIYAIMPLHPKD